MNALLVLGTVVLVLICCFMVLVILAQRAKSDGGVGAALGGGMTEAAFGADSGNVLSKATTWATVTFFVLSLLLYLGHLNQRHGAAADSEGLLPSSPELLPGPVMAPETAPVSPEAGGLVPPLENAPVPVTPTPADGATAPESVPAPTPAPANP